MKFIAALLKGNVNSGSFSPVNLWSDSLQTAPLTNKGQVTWTLAWHTAFRNSITTSHSTPSRSEVASYSARPILPAIWFCHNFGVTQPCALGRAVSFSLCTIITNSYNRDYMAWQGEHVFFWVFFRKKSKKVTDLCFRKMPVFFLLITGISEIGRSTCHWILLLQGIRCPVWNSKAALSELLLGW